VCVFVAAGGMTMEASRGGGGRLSEKTLISVEPPCPIAASLPSSSG
jgi:hypothetical protein